MKEFIEELKKFMAEDDEDIENALTKEQIAKAERIGEKEATALKEALGIVRQYEEDIPDDIEGAILTFVAKASYDYPVVEEEVGKAGAKLSKTTQAQIKEALGHIKDGPKAVTILETLLGVETKKAEKDGDENLSAETLARLERLEQFEKNEKERIEKEEKEKADKEKKEKEEVLERIEALEKKKGIKKSIDGQEGEEEKKGADDEEDDYPSIPLLVKN